MFLSKGYKGYYYLYYIDPSTSKKRKVSTGTKLKKEAKKFLLSFHPKNITVPEVVQQPIITITDLKVDVLQYAKINFSAKTIALYEYSLRHLIRIFGNKPLNMFTVRDLEYYKAERINTVSKTTVNIELRTIKSIFNYAKTLNYVDENPISKVKQFALPQKEKLSFSNEEISYLIHVIDNQLIKKVVIFALYTGCRITEILNVQLRNIDMENKHIDIINKADFKTKTGKVRRIPISDKLHTLLEDEITSSDSKERYLFHSLKTKKYDKNFISKKFKTYLRLAGFSEKYHFHCLRHTFITNLIKSGVNLNYVRELAGHTDIQTTMGYIHIETEDLRDAVNRINIKIG